MWHARWWAGCWRWWALGSIWGDFAADRERRRRKQRQAEERFRRAVRADEGRVRRAAAVTDRAERAEQARRDRAELVARAARLDAELQADVAGLTGLLRAAAAEPARNLAVFRQSVPVEEPPRIEEVAGPPRPEWSRFSPDLPGGLFGRRRYERALIVARAQFEQALADHDRRRQEAFAGVFREYQEGVLRRTREHETRWDVLGRGVESGDSDAVSEFSGEILHGSPALHGLFDGGRGTFEMASRELVLEIDLPDTDVVPVERAWKYIHARKAVEPVMRRRAEALDLYASLVAQLTLAVLDACFRGFGPEVVDAVSVNGHVRTIDPATGRPNHPCLITVSADRSMFAVLDLHHQKLDPVACLRKLGAEMSPNPYNLEHIPPIVDFEMAKYRIAYGPEALAKVDHRMDLLKMNPYEFERLVKDLFAKMGYDTWRTESSRDDGIDAVATKSDPYMPVECIVQAKRFRGLVSPKEVQALMGAMAEKPTVTHGYLVTTSWLSPRSRQRARGQRIFTIERNQLASMIKELLGFEVLISNKPPLS